MGALLVLFHLRPDGSVDDPGTGVPILTALSTAAGFGVGSYDVRAKTRRRELRQRNRELEDTQAELEETVHRLAETNTRLEESNTRLEHYRQYTDEVLDAIHDVFYVIAADGSLKRWNESLSDVTGYADAALSSMTFAGLVADDDRETVTNGIMEGVETGRTQFEAELCTSDGTRVPYEFAASTLEVRDEEPVLAGIGRDISERKARERALEESEQRYRTLAENFPNGAVVLLDDDLRHTLVEGQGFEKLDFDADDLRGERVRDVYPPEIREQMEPNYRAALDGESNSFELPLQGRTFEFRVLPLTTDDEVFGILAMSQDITERKQRERALEQRARQQRVVADLGQFALETDDLDELMREATRNVADVLDNEYCKVLDLDEEEEELLLRQGVGWRDGLVGEASVSAVEAESQAAVTLANDGPIVVEDIETDPRLSGPELLTSHDVHSGISTVIGPFDEPWGILGTHDTERRTFTDEDVTFVQSVANVLAEAIERQQYREELEELVVDLEKSNERLAESNERLEQFAYAASHDLQEPLRMVSTYLQLIERRYADELDEDGVEFLEFAVDGAERMRSMIDGLLQYSRVETQGDEFEPVDLEGVLADARDDLRMAIEESDAEITAASLPRVEGDEGQLRQVFENLLSNAIRYSGAESPRIHVAAERNGTDWIVSVTDEGIGIDPADQERIFEIFEGLPAADGYAGTGIGLAVCERIVERHDGEIWVDSQPGDETTFSFTLPPVDADGDD
uniref:histidine kinase n=2 Tax=Haloterrigena alkaliphila TaxID=2816475 RepID=A0A8A2VL39_9EURY